jgi:hypothetical protein
MHVHVHVRMHMQQGAAVVSCGLACMHGLGTSPWNGTPCVAELEKSRAQRIGDSVSGVALCAVLACDALGCTVLR